MKVHGYKGFITTGKHKPPDVIVDDPVDFIVVRDDQGTPIVLIQAFPNMGDMTRFAVLTPQHGEDFQRALKALNLNPLTVSKLVL